MKTSFAFLDTNIFLHFQPIDQIDWLNVLEADEVVLTIAPVILGELDDKKDQHRLSKIQDRARKALKKIEQFDAAGEKDPLRDSVYLRVIAQEPRVDFSQHSLDPNVNDDRLIASCLSFRQENPDTLLTLVTDDTTPRIKAKRHDIEALSLPKKYRLPSALSDVEKENRRLKQQVQKLEHQFPELSLEFADGKQHVKFTLPAPVSLSEDEIRKRLERAKEKHPKQKVPSDDEPSERASSSLQDIVDVAARFNRPSPQTIERYNENLDEYYEALQTFWRNYAHYKNLGRRTVRLDMRLVNKGTVPAEDIDIFMHFPDGFAMCAKHDRPSMPDKPEPPNPPKATGALGLSNINLPDPSHVSPSFPRDIPISTNVSSPDIQQTNSYEVNVGVTKLKQHLSETCDPLFVVFHSHDSADSFGIDYRINAANLPQEEEGRLNVVIEKEQS